MNRPLALVIEDEEDLASIFSRVLDMGQFDCQSVRDGYMALEQLATTLPDLVLLDLHLPHVSGVEILHQIRASERLNHTRVVVITADLAKAETLVTLADAVLIKPIRIKQLLETVTDLYPPEPASGEEP
jgi:two-component system cell cycle response regulator DivK